MSNQFKVPTQKVRIKDENGNLLDEPVFINVSDFDPAIHTPVEEERKKLAKPLVRRDDEDEDDDEEPAKAAPSKKK